MKPTHLLSALLLSGCSLIINRQLDACGDGVNDEDCLAEVCDNDLDDDGDGLVDCEDPDCAQLSVCASVCGDAVISGREECDGALLDDQSCPDIDPGFASGVLACSAECSFDVSGCRSAFGGGVTLLDVESDARALVAGDFFSGADVELALASPSKQQIDFYPNNSGVFSPPEADALGLAPDFLVATKRSPSNPTEGVLFFGDAGNGGFLGFLLHQTSSQSLVNIDQQLTHVLAAQLDASLDIDVITTTKNANNTHALTVTKNPLINVNTSDSVQLASEPLAVFFDKILANPVIIEVEAGDPNNSPTRVNYFSTIPSLLSSEAINASGTRSALLADLDNDSLPDLITISAQQLKVFFQETANQPADIFNNEPLLLLDTSGANIIDVASIVINGELHLLVVTDQDELLLVDNSGASVALIAVDDASDAELVVADFNSDNAEDFAVLLPGEGKLKVFFAPTP